jgi:DNA-binding NarL/FixJ family response regulator
MNTLGITSLPAASAAAVHQVDGNLSFHGVALIVEDDMAVAGRMQRILGTLAPEGHVAIARTRDEAFGLLATRPYAMVLVEMGLPGGEGAAMIRELRAAYPRIDPIAMSAADDDELVSAALAAGATGYLLTGAGDAELAFLLGAVERGGAPVDARVARRIIGLIAAAARLPVAAVAAVAATAASAAQALPGGAADADAARAAVPHPSKSLLSPRELKVLRLIAQGWSNRQIAESVYLSVNTIEFHAKSIYRKLAVKSRTQAVHEAMQHGLLN